MDEDTANRTIAQLTLPVGFTAEPLFTPDSVYIVHIENSDGWMCEFSFPDQALWAQQQINAASQ